MVSSLAMKQAYVTSFTLKSMLYFLISVVFAFLFFCMFIVVMVGAVIVTESQSDYHYLRLSYLPMGFLAVSLFKPINHYAYKHTIANDKLMSDVMELKHLWVDDDEERTGTNSYIGGDRDLVNWSKDNNCTEMDDSL